MRETYEIWSKEEYNGADENFAPTLTNFLLNFQDDASYGAILILPGGGYGFTSWREAEPIAYWANASGYHAFILHYSVAPNRHPQPLLDATRAMCIIRDNAKKWKVDPSKIAVCGFSAGGHAAGALATMYDEPYLLDIQGMEKGKNRPNAAILSYPVITGGEKAHRGSFDNLLGENADSDMIRYLSLENRVHENMPPVFLWHTVSDSSVPVENSLLFANALTKHKVPFEMHIYPEGPHGLSLANRQTAEQNPSLINPHVGTWTTLCKQWLDEIFA